MNSCGMIDAICLSEKKHTAKTSVPQAFVVQDFGLQGDAHAGPGDRQISLLSSEAIAQMKMKKPDLTFGMFGENLVVSGLDCALLKKGSRLLLGQHALIEITQIGKDCHEPCAIHREVGFCVMPTQGLFAKVLHSGWIFPKEKIVCFDRSSAHSFSRSS